MSITPAERKSYEDRVREAREEAEKREADLVKRQNAELRRMEKHQAEELQNVNQTYENSLEGSQQNDREALSRRDMKHNEDVENLREMYVDSLKKKMEENVTQRRELEDTYGEEIRRQKETSLSQHQHLTDRQIDEIKSKDASVASALDDNRRGMKKGLDDIHDRLDAAHEKEKASLIHARDEALARKEREMSQMRTSLGQELKAEKLGRRRDNALANEKNYSTVRNFEAEENATLDSQREALKQEVDHQREIFDSRWNEKNDSIDGINDKFKDQVTDRQNTQINAGHTRIKELETKLNGEVIQGNRRRSLEARHLTDEYERKWHELNKEKEDSQDAAMDLAHDRVNTVHDGDNQVLRQATREYRSQAALVNNQNKEARDNLIQSSAEEKDRTLQVTDRRIEKMDKYANQKIKTAADQYEQAQNQIKDIYAEKMERQQELTTAEQNRYTGSMNERFKGIESKYQNKLDVTSAGYEDKISQMKDNFEKEKKRIEDAYQQRLADEQKGSKLERSSVEQKYEAKIASNEQLYREELDRVNKRHEEDIKAIANRYSKKA